MDTGIQAISRKRCARQLNMDIEVNLTADGLDA
jgi:hypothetical protein